MPAPVAPFPANFVEDAAALMPDLMWSEITDDGGDELLACLPFSYEDANQIRIDQYGNPYGLTPLRGLDAVPEMVPMPGVKVWVVSPGYYGMKTQLRESEITQARQPGTLADPLDVSEMLGVYVNTMATKNVSRFRQTAGELLTGGSFTNRNASGELVHKYTVDDYQTFAPANDGNTGPGWAADPANATPITDLIYWQTNRLNRGTSASFGADSKLLCNPITVNIFWNTQQVQAAFKDKYGASYLRGNNGNTTPNLDGDQSINALLMGMGLPKLVPYTKGYYATAAGAVAEDPDDFVFAIPDQGLIWAGKRPGGQISGSFKLTRFAGRALESELSKYPSSVVKNEQTAAMGQGLYFRAKFRDELPFRYDLESAFNAAPIIYYRRAFAGITTG